MANQANVGTVHDKEFDGFRSAYRPRKDGTTLINKRTGAVSYKRGNILVHSALRKDEWQELDEIVVEAAGQGTTMLADLPKKTHESIGVLVAQYNTQSQLTEADVTMTGRSRGQMDAVDYNLVSVPIPVVFKEIELGERELVSSRRLGSGLDTASVFEATRVVVEKLADMLYNGFTSISFNGATIYGLSNHPNLNSVSGSDWGTISNIHPNVVAMIGASLADNYRGPWTLDVATTQYGQMLARYTDGSSNNAFDELLKIPNLDSIVQADQLTDGSAILRQNGRNVLEWQQVNLGGQNVNGIQIALLEWMSGDGMVHHMKVMAIASPIVKADYETQSGITEITGI